MAENKLSEFGEEVTEKTGEVLSAVLTSTVEDKTLLLKHKLQIYGFWTILILAVGAIIGFRYCSQENKKFFEIAVAQGSFYIVGKDGKGKVYDLTERALQPAAPSPSSKGNE